MRNLLWTGRAKLQLYSALLLVVLISTNKLIAFATTDQSDKPQELKNIIVTSALNAGGFITTEKKAHLSGIRVEDQEPGDDGFIGYTEKGISIVQPNTAVRIVFFGWWMDEVILVGFTINDNCVKTEGNVTQADFTIQTERRLVIDYTFPATTSIFKVCMKQKPRENGDPMPYLLIDDLRTSVSTDLPPRKYYFPMGIQIAIISVLLILSALFSGLNLGLMALTPQELTLISKSGSKRERVCAETILPVRRSGNFLLCSLLIGNVCVNSAISILFDDLTSGYVALVSASAGIVVFGEICPQSLCVKKGLEVGARTIWITRFFMVLTFPLAFPISKILDCILGDEIAVGAMEISDKTVQDVMTKITDVFMLPDTTILNTKTVAEILRMGYTRIPVYSGDRNNVVSLLFVKDLALIDPDDSFSGDYHLAMVQKIVQADNHDPVYELSGIVTLEDIVEEILQAEIVDETDAITDNVTRIRRRRAMEHDFTHCLLDNDGGACQISMQMQLVTMQWLATNHPAFHEDFISYTVLEKVELTHLGDTKDPNMVLPRTSKLYTKKEPSDKFILILEGRALVTIGQNEMTFEAGPWHCFGNELLDRLHQITATMRKNQTTQSPRNSQSGLPANSQNTANITAFSQLNDVDTKKITFIPDFTATIRDDCTYLEICAQTYLLAYKSTLINKNRNDGTYDPKDMNFERDDLQAKNELPLNKVTAEGHLEEDVVTVRPNGSLKRKSVSCRFPHTLNFPCFSSMLD
ncbi:hypothetical protein M3Y94_00808100 [Aphelenchoides besseyi]|nr:hypothetical protein M3Y94_00808100 [Aphelenchoides besseyi]